MIFALVMDCSEVRPSSSGQADMPFERQCLDLLAAARMDGSLEFENLVSDTVSRRNLVQRDEKLELERMYTELAMGHMSPRAVSVAAQELSRASGAHRQVTWRHHSPRKYTEQASQ